MKKIILSFILFCSAFFIFAEEKDLFITAEDTVIICNEDSTYDLFIRKKPGIESVMLVDSALDKDTNKDTFALRATEYNPVNGDEIRFLNGKKLESVSSRYSIISSTVINNETLGECFHLFIPKEVVYGYPWTRNGKIDTREDFTFNIRTFEKKYCDYSGAYKNNLYSFTHQKFKRTVKTIKPAVKKIKTKRPAAKKPEPEKTEIPEPKIIVPEIKESIAPVMPELVDIPEDDIMEETLEEEVLSPEPVIEEEKEEPELEEYFEEITEEEPEESFEEMIEEEPEEDFEEEDYEEAEPEEEEAVEESEFAEALEEITEEEPEESFEEMTEEESEENFEEEDYEEAEPEEEEPVENFAETLFSNEEDESDYEEDLLKEPEPIENTETIEETETPEDKEVPKEKPEDAVFSKKNPTAYDFSFIFDDGKTLKNQITDYGITLQYVKGDGKKIPDMYVGITEITNEQYQAIIDYGAYNPSSKEYPVTEVSKYDAMVFCNRLSERAGFEPCYSINGSTDTYSWGEVPRSANKAWDKAICNPDANGYRLLTVQEWIYTAEGGQYKTKTKFAGSNKLEDIAWTGFNSGSPRPVGIKTPNELGIYDMTGNVSEWCWGNTHDFIRKGAVMGGNFSYAMEFILRIKFKDRCQSWYPHYENGIRICRTIMPDKNSEE